MANCEAQCIQMYTDGQLQIPPGPVDAVNSPFVIAEFFDEGTIITVGNESSPKAPNTAAIVSFQYGRTNGTGVTLEIVDEEGGDFEHFFRKISASVETAKRYVTRVRWGWIGTSCNGGGGISSQSQWHYFQVQKFSIKYESKIKFVLEGIDPMNQIMQTRVDKTYTNITLKNAIRQLCRDNVIPVNTVRFLRTDDTGKVAKGEWDFKGAKKDTWQTSGQHLLQTITRWMQTYTTDAGKGVIPTWDDTTNDYTLILWEDPAPASGQNSSSSTVEKKPIRAYVVNGGDCSNVISFSTNVTGNVTIANHGASLAGGGIDAGTGVSHNQSEGNAAQNNVGTTTTLQIPETARNSYGTDAAEETIKAGKKQESASIYFSTVLDLITAELKIMGDPTLDLGIYLLNQRVGIAVINPFNIVNFGDRLEWKVSGGSMLAESSCNKILSRKDWLLSGFSHDIRDGSYTTTLNVKQIDGPKIISGESQ